MHDFSKEVSKNMPLYDAAAIEKYRELLKKDPNSQAFAPLADAYRELGQYDVAEKFVRDGLRKHPQFAGGYVVLGKILKDRSRFEEALRAFKKAVDIAPENLLSHQLIGDVYLELKQPREALKSYKMVLFLNPHSAKAKKITEKLESLTAVDYDDDVFEMAQLQQLDQKIDQHSQANQVGGSNLRHEEIEGSSKTRTLHRSLSLLDAYVVRNDLKKAGQVLDQAISEFGAVPELLQRQKVLKHKTQNLIPSLPIQINEATDIKPLASREKMLTQKKLETLQMLLRKIESYKAEV
jgi:tetratricopeptide (TPR) repeat protein